MSWYSSCQIPTISPSNPGGEGVGDAIDRGIVQCHNNSNNQYGDPVLHDREPPNLICNSDFCQILQLHSNACEQALTNYAGIISE